MKTKEKPKKKKWETKDPTYHTHTYGNEKNPFDIEWVKHYNEKEGKDQIIFLYCAKGSKNIVKYRIL